MCTKRWISINRMSKQVLIVRNPKVNRTLAAKASSLATATIACATTAKNEISLITNYRSRPILRIRSKPLFIRWLSMDLSLVICGIVMIFLISLEETTLQGSKVFSHFFVDWKKLKLLELTWVTDLSFHNLFMGLLSEKNRENS